MQERTLSEKLCLNYLQESLPPADKMQLTGDECLRIVRHCLRVREELPWGVQIPDDCFLPFVLFPRVNNEDATFYHETLYAMLAPRISALGMKDAILQINLWCAERVTYHATDNRTASAGTTLRRGFGRCGEESVLLVSALRACGIPARQIYVPRWSHCDDNHAWVEAWADGQWHYLGACEPEPVLDSGWFTAAASKAMLIHTHAYGMLPEGENCCGKRGGAYIINRTDSYARCTMLQVRIVCSGQPLAGISVEFCLLNSAELFVINRQISDENGLVTLRTGLGTLLVRTSDNKRYIEESINVDENATLEVDFSAALAYETEPRLLHQAPPKETALQPSIFPMHIAAKHSEELKQCESMRSRAHAHYDCDDNLIASARGNACVIKSFLNGMHSPEDARALLESLREKDLVDASSKMLEDALCIALPYKEQYPRQVWVKSVLRPRVSNEMLYPDRTYLRALDVPSEPRAILSYLQARLTLEEMMPEGLFPSMRGILEYGRCSPIMLDVLFVKLCRAKGIAARLNPGTLEKEVWVDGNYRALVQSEEQSAKLLLTNEGAQEKKYGLDFSFARLDSGSYSTLQLWDTPIVNQLEMELAPGHYRLICCTRQIDGSMDALLLPFELKANEALSMSLRFPPDRGAMLKLNYALPELPVLSMADEPTSLPQGRRSILAFIAPGAEPSEHFLNEIASSLELIDAMDVEIDFILEEKSLASNAKLQELMKRLKHAALYHHPDPELLAHWRKGMNAGDLRLPLAVAADADGRGLFAFANYHVGSLMSLLRLLE